LENLLALSGTRKSAPPAFLAARFFGAGLTAKRDNASGAAAFPTHGGAAATEEGLPALLRLTVYGGAGGR